MMMPSIVSAERSLLTRSAASAIRRVARKLMARAGRATRRRRRPPERGRGRRDRGADRDRGGAGGGRRGGKRRATSGVCRTSVTTRPSRNTRRRDAKAAMSCSCVTTTMVMPRRLSACSSAITSMLVAESSAPVGSSARISFGSLTSARAMATRCCWPPESCAGWWCSRPARPTSASRALARAWRSPAGTPAYSSGSSTFSCALVRGSRLNCWNTKPMSRLRTSASASPSRCATSLPARR